VRGPPRLQELGQAYDGMLARLKPVSKNDTARRKKIVVFERGQK